MAAVVFVHAHPDDESISTGGTIARASAEGHRVILVVATGGEHGETPGDLAADETLLDRRRAETERSCAVLGVHRLVWLGYTDSGMTGWEQNHDPRAFMNADPDEAARRLLGIVDEESAAVLVGYDWHGGYGHPDHIAVHRAVSAAAVMRPELGVWEATMNRDRIRERMRAAREAGPAGADETWDPDSPADDGNPFGTPEAEISLCVDVREFAALKRASIACHSSQVSDAGFFMQMPDEAFREAFGIEWFIAPAAGGPPREGFIL